MLAQSGPVYSYTVPRLLRWLGARDRIGRHFRTAWGELAFGRRGWALALCLFGDPQHYSFHVMAFRASLFIDLPFLSRWAYDPPELMDKWGVLVEEGDVHLSWAEHTKIAHLPWRNWRQVSHDVRCADGSWEPFVGSWEHDKAPDHRAVEIYPYRYLLRSGDVQDRTAAIYVERRVRRLKLLRWTSLFQRVSYAIDVEFDDEVGERTGSWKGGTIGCGYELRPDETPYECLKRMERDRKF